MKKIVSFPFIHQRESMDCGPTCLQMIAKHYGKSIPLQYLRERSQIGKEGVNILGISEAAENIGFRTQAVKLDYRSLISEVKLPCILHWDQQHFVVLYKVRRSSRLSRKNRENVERLYIADPAHDLVSFPSKDFLHRWTSDKDGDGNEEGVALLLEPSPNLQSFDPDAAYTMRELGFRSILNYVLPYRKLILQLLFGLGVSTILQLIIPFLTQSVIDVGVNSANIHFVYIVLLAQTALVSGRLIAETVRSWILLHMSTRINISILTDFLIKLMKLPLAFFDSKKTGDVLQRMNDHQRIESFLTGSSINLLFSFFNLVVFSIVLAAFNARIFEVFIAASLFYSLWVFLFLKKRKALDYKRFDIAAREQGTTIQLVQGMQEIKLNGVEKPMRWKWERLQAKLFKLSIKGLALNQWQQSGGSFINECKNVLITFLSAKAVIDGQMTLGAMLGVQYIIGQLNSPIEQMIGFVQNWQNARISLNRLNEVHKMEDEEPENKSFLQHLPGSFARRLTGGKMKAESQYDEFDIPEGRSGYPPSHRPDRQDKEQAAIYFDKVSFTYSGAGNEPVLKNISLSIPKGKTTAIVGVSGSGKTTLVKLLLKFYEPQKGTIKLGNTLLSSISHRLWRSYCGVVMQESYIFSDTIARNIAVCAERIDSDRLDHAALVANIADFIESLPMGYNTQIGAEGIGISMGQKQRILIARAVYRDPEFIFFDEATNSLDANNERIITDNLAAFVRNKTVVVVAHRLSTVKNADQIIVLDKGEIAEQGTHQQLTAMKGEYYTLVKNQLELGE